MSKLYNKINVLINTEGHEGWVCGTIEDLLMTTELAQLSYALVALIEDFHLMALKRGLLVYNHANIDALQIAEVVTSAGKALMTTFINKLTPIKNLLNKQVYVDKRMHKVYCNNHGNDDCYDMDISNAEYDFGCIKECRGHSGVCKENMRLPGVHHGMQFVDLHCPLGGSLHRERYWDTNWIGTTTRFCDYAKYDNIFMGKAHYRCKGMHGNVQTTCGSQNLCIHNHGKINNANHVLTKKDPLTKAVNTFPRLLKVLKA